MGKSTGFLEYGRVNDPAQDPAERIRDFHEFHNDIDPEERSIQGARCMNCGLAFCQSGIRMGGSVTGCPLHNLIPEWNDELYQGTWDQALARLRKTNNFPEFTGRVCPALCESSCTEGLYDDPVTIRENELALIEWGFATGTVRPQLPEVRSGKKVAVIGSGPAGLACADRLNHRGHLVTVYERDDRPGGLLMYGIPNMKLEKSVVLRRVELMKAEGVNFVLNADVGHNLDAQKILDDYDAVILCCGAREPRNLDVPGRDAAGVLYAVDFLTDVMKELFDKGLTEDVPTFTAHVQAALAGTDEAEDREMPQQTVSQPADASSQTGAQPAGAPGQQTAPAGQAGADAPTRPAPAATDPAVTGKNILIVGGGDTGNDCVGTCVRLGAASVHQLVRRPKRPDTRPADNPWPEVSTASKIDYGQEESIAVLGYDPRIYQTRIREIVKDEEGHIKEVVTVRSEPEKNPDGTPKTDERGRVRMVEVPGSEQTLPCDLLLLATGFSGCQPYIFEHFGVDISNRGAVRTLPDSYDCGTGKVFTAGDARRGASLVVYAIAEGRACAREVDSYLMGYSNLL